MKCMHIQIESSFEKIVKSPPLRRGQILQSNDLKESIQFSDIWDFRIIDKEA